MVKVMSTEFNYILEKIKASEIVQEPFPHLHIKNFLSDDHLKTIINDDQIHFEEVSSTEELILTLQRKGYIVTPHAGCITDIHSYLESLKTNNFPTDKGLLEGYGLAFRLTKYQNPLIERLISFMNGEDFKMAFMDKFGVKQDSVIMSAIQKYLNKYEISPHPDVRQKSMTYLLNINKDDSIENHDVHTYLMKFKDGYKAIEKHWDDHPEHDRAWVPWDWCEEVKVIKENNSIVAFAPTNASLHAVKLNYDHNNFQRTQIYGNCFYKVNGADVQLGTWARRISRLYQPKYNELKQIALK